jgi:hypothetical protein
MVDAIPTLSISTEKICFVVLKAREFDVKDADTSSDEDGSNPVDDRMVDVLEDRPDDPVDQETAVLQRLFEQFPTLSNRENILRIRELLRKNREFQRQNCKP